MAYSVDPKITSKDQEELHKFKKEFAADYDSNKAWLERKKEWFDFYHGRQWSDEEKQDLEARGQPPVVRNRIKPKIDAMVGVELALKVNTKALDRGTRDFETAKFISEALRLIEDDNDFDSLEARAFSAMLKCGRGWYMNEIDWVDLEAFTKVTELSVDDVIPDRTGRKNDMSDWKRVHYTFMMDLDDAKERWPEFKTELEEAVYAKENNEKYEEKKPHKNVIGDQYNSPYGNDIAYGDDETKRVRIIRTWYRTQVWKKYITHPEFGTEEITKASSADIKKIKEMFSGAQEWAKVEQKMNCVTFTCHSILEHQLDTRPYDVEAKFPIVLVPGWYDEEMGYHVGVIEQMLDPQKEINKRGSKMLHLLNTNQIEMEEGAVDDLNRTRYEAARPDGVIVRKRGFQMQINKNVDIATSQFQLLQEAKVEIDASGAAQELTGQSGANSGKEFQLRQQAAIQPIRELFLNLRASRRQVAKIWLDDIQQYWRAERFIKLTDDPEGGMVELNKRVVDPVTGEVKILNDVSIGRYDIKIEEAMDTPNMRIETFDKMIKLAQLGIPIPPEMIIENSDMPNKGKFLKGMQEMQQQALAQGMVPGQNGPQTK